MKKIILGVVSVLMLSLFPITVKADEIVISNLAWDMNGTETDPSDDVITFQAPDGYRDLSYNAAYRYTISDSITNHDSSLYSSSYTKSVSIDATGKVTVKFSDTTFYGIGGDYSISVSLADSNKKVIAKSAVVTKKIDITKLEQPSKLFAGATAVSYGRPFGALKFEISHFDSTGSTLKEPVGETDKLFYRFTVSAQLNDVIRVVAVNGTVSSDAAEATVATVVAIDDLKWNTNGTDNDSTDDTLTFTMPEGYRNVSGYQDADYVEYKININDKGGYISTGSYGNTTVDSNGAATVNLSKIYGFGSALSYNISVTLTNSSNQEICTSNSVSKTYTIDKLEKPENVSLNGNRVIFSTVFGASKYQISHYDKDGNEVEKSFEVTSSYDAHLTVTPVGDDVIKVVAMNDTLKSEATEYVVIDTTIRNLAWHDNDKDDPTDDTLTFTAPKNFRKKVDSTYIYGIGLSEKSVAMVSNNSSYFTMDETTGNVTIQLKDVYGYGNGLDYNVRVILYKPDYTMLSSASLKKTITVTSLATPTGLTYDGSKLTFNKALFATKYKITHLDKDKKQVEAPIEVSTNSCAMTGSFRDGDVISVIAENDMLVSEPAYYTYMEPITINDVTWNDQGTDDPMDDTLTFTTSMNRLESSLSGAYYYTIKVCASAPTEVLQESSSNFIVDKTTGKVTIPLSKVLGYGSTFSYKVQLSLLAHNGHSIATFNSVSHDFPVKDLTTPTITSIYTTTSGKYGMSFNKVFGAIKYHVSHLNKDGEDAENIIDSSVNYITFASKLEDGDVIEVYADNADQDSPKDTYTVKLASITDLKWNDQGTDDPQDDTLTFTAPEGYRDFGSDKYYYLYSLDGNKNLYYFNRGYNTTINPTTGLVTLRLGTSPEYVKDGKYTAKLRIVNTENKVYQVICDSDIINFDVEEKTLQKPLNLFVGADKVTFDKSFNAEKYEISHYDNTGKTLVEPVITTSYTTTCLKQEPKNGEIVRVVAVKGDQKSEASEYTVQKVIQMTSLSWVENNPKVLWDDELTFTTPDGYNSLDDIAKYYYELRFVLPNGDEVKLPLSNDGAVNRAYIDEATGKVQIPLSDKWWFGDYADYDCYVALVSAENQNVICQTPHARYTSAITALEAPTYLHLNSGTIQFNLVYGATKYTVTHYDVKGNVKEGPMDATWKYSYAFAPLKDISEGDTIKVTASREGSTVSASEATYTVVGLVPATEVTLDHKSLEIDGTNSAQLKATVGPVEATNKGIVWKTSDSSVAVVDETGKVTGVNPGTAVISAVTNDGGHVATCDVNVLLNGKDISKIKPFVTSLYTTTLDRDPDQQGMNYWLEQLSTGKQTGTQIVYSFVFGDEFKAKNYCNEHFVTHLYKAIFNRDADAAGLEYWEGAMKKGASREAVLNGFISGDEFKALCAKAEIKVGTAPKTPAKGTIQTWTCPLDKKMDNKVGSFVLRMYTKCLNRDAEEDGTSYWTSQLYQGKEGGTSVAHKFFFGDEFVAQKLDDTEYVKRLYLTFFDREGDEAGMKYWVDSLKKGASRESVFLGFANSAEWNTLCSTYGIKK